MKLKYYLRGLGIGIIVTTIILTISFGGKETDIDDIPVEEVIAKATMLGMVMPEDTETPATEQQDGTEAAFGEDTENGNSAAEDENITQPEAAEPQDNETDDGNQVQADGDAAVAPEDAADGETADIQGDTDGDNSTADGQESEEARTPYRLVVNRGDVCRTVCENLAANGLIEDAEVFRKYLQEIGYASFISVGNYDIPYGLTQEEIANVLKNGPIEEQQ